MTETLILERLDELAALVKLFAPEAEDARLKRVGLIGYEGLRERLAVDGKMPCMRTVKALVERHRRVILPVAMGHRTVGFRAARVEAFLAHLSGEPANGGRQC